MSVSAAGHRDRDRAPQAVRRPADGARERAGADPADRPYRARPDAAPDDPAGWSAGSGASGAAAGRARPRVRERGLRSWQALLVLVVVAAIGAVVDALLGGGRQTAFAVALVVGSLAAIVLVRRSGMFPVVVAPPIVYVVGSAITLYARSGGLSDRRVLIDAATSWLVYGFPAIAGATALVLIVAGIRLALRR